jgi:hypothetical protein
MSRSQVSIGAPSASKCQVIVGIIEVRLVNRAMVRSWLRAEGGSEEEEVRE